MPLPPLVCLECLDVINQGLDALIHLHRISGSSERNIKLPRTGISLRMAQRWPEGNSPWVVAERIIS